MRRTRHPYRPKRWRGFAHPVTEPPLALPNHFFCSTFVLMNSHQLLSDAANGPARRSGLGHRFVHWRGSSGIRHLFSAVPFDTLQDYRSAVAVLAERTSDGLFLAWTAAEIDASGRIHPLDDSWPSWPPASVFAFVHFLTEDADTRRAMIKDIFGVIPMREETQLALAA